MIKIIRNSFRHKSLKERFILVIGLLFLMSYILLGLLFIFIKTIPFQMEYEYRIAFGLLLIAYSVFRFVRIINDNNDEG